jgi:hypothetical protein
MQFRLLSVENLDVVFFFLMSSITLILFLQRQYAVISVITQCYFFVYFFILCLLVFYSHSHNVNMQFFHLISQMSFLSGLCFMSLIMLLPFVNIQHAVLLSVKSYFVGLVCLCRLLHYSYSKKVVFYSPLSVLQVYRLLSVKTYFVV